MFVPLAWQDAVSWYKGNVQKPLEGLNYPYYHPCCNVYTTKKAKKARESHTEHISFANIFKFTVEGNEQNRQVQNFVTKYLKDWKTMPEKNSIHTKKFWEISDEEEQMEKMRKSKEKKAGQLFDTDSAYAKDLEYSDPETKKFEEKLLKRVQDAEFGLSKFRPEIIKLTTMNQKLSQDNQILIEDNKRLSDELAQVKLEQAEQKKALEALTAKFEAFVKVSTDGLLSKRSPLENQKQGDQTAKVVLEENQHSSQKAIGLCGKAKTKMTTKFGHK